MSKPCYRIKNWNEIYENNRTRALKNMMWLPLPIKLNGYGYTLIMEEKEGLALFGGFVVLLEIASQCTPRGTFITKNKIPHDSAALVRLSRMKVRDCEKVLDYHLTQTKWLELIDLETGAVIPQEGAGKVPDGCALPALQEKTVQYSTEQYSTGEKSIYKKFAHLKLLTKEFERLKEKGFTQLQIDTVLLKIENFRQNTKYKSLYLTSLDWLKREFKKESEKVW